MTTQAVWAGRLRSCSIAVLILLGGCGGQDSDTTTLKVAAASSLREAFQDYGAELEGTKASFSFAGSDELAAQIREGIRPDVFASANTKLPLELYSRGLVEKPVEFAANRLVVAVAAGSKAVRSLDDLQREGVRVAVGAPSVPVGAYTEQVIARLGTGRAKRVLANVRSREPDVTSIAAKVAQGAVDAGFVYVTDVRAANAELRAIELPDRLQPRVAYAAAVVERASHAREAGRFIDRLLHGEGQVALQKAGFERPRQ